MTTTPTYSRLHKSSKPALARGYLRVIAALTMGEQKRLDDDPAFKRRFSSVVEKPTPRADSLDSRCRSARHAHALPEQGRCHI